MIAQDGKDWIVAVVVATEVPPPGTTALDEADIVLAIQAVCNVIKGRAHDPRFPNDPVLVVLEPKQFSAVGREDYWRKACANLWFPHHVQACLDTWRSTTPSPVAQGALWYYSPISMDPPGRVPDWVDGKAEVPVPGLSRDFFRFYR
jgi:hypothetical protein